MTDSFSVRPHKLLTAEEKKARDAARRTDAVQAMLEHEAAQRAFDQNRQRLKAERLAREAALVHEKKCTSSADSMLKDTRTSKR
jgi:hypothetical protein